MAEWVAYVEARLVWADAEFVVSDEPYAARTIFSRLRRAGRDDLAAQFLPLLSQRSIDRHRGAA